MTVPAIPERRPLASRETGWAKGVAAWLGRLGASPNGISVVGMLSAIAAGACLVMTSRFEPLGQSICFLASALLAFVRLLANMFDGMVAITTGRTSLVGELFNEVPDRISDSAILIGAGYAVGGQVELGYAAACLAVFIAYLRVEGKVAGAHQEYCGPMAKPQRMTVFMLAAVASAFVPQQALIESTRLGILGWALVVILAGGAITVVRRLAKIGAVLRRNRP